MTEEKWSDRQRARFILGKLGVPQLSAEMVGQIQGWLVSGDNEIEKEVALAEIWEDLCQKQVDSRSGRAERMWKDWQKRIGWKPPSPVRKPLPGRFRRRITVAAFVVVIVTALLLVKSKSTRPGVRNGDPLPYVTVTTDGTTGKRIELPDGTIVRMNRGTTLSYVEDFLKDRHIKLDGEAYFSVAEIKDNPFRVENGGITVTALGTEFNIDTNYSEEGEMVVSLTKGEVEVADGRANTFRLAPLEQLVYHKQSGRGQITGFPSLMIDLWRTGTKSLESVPLPVVLEILEELYERKVVVTGELPADKTVTTLLRQTDSLEDVLDILGFMFEGLTWRINNHTIEIEIQAVVDEGETAV